MKRDSGGTWHIDRIDERRHPYGPVEEWGSKALGEHFAYCLEPDSPIRANAHALAGFAFEFMTKPTYYPVESPFPWAGESFEVEQPLEVHWPSFELDAFVEYMTDMHDPAPDRFFELLSCIDLFADYLVATGEISDVQLESWVAKAQEQLSEFEDGPKGLREA